MEANQHIDILRIRTQSKWLVTSAVFFLALSFSIALPRALKRRAHLKSENTEILLLQAEISDTERKIQDVQQAMLKAQAEIEATENEHKR
jgi:hypothetical protein